MGRLTVVIKWPSIVLGAVLLLAVLALGIIYGASEYQMRRYADVPAGENRRGMWRGPDVQTERRRPGLLRG